MMNNPTSSGFTNLETLSGTVVMLDTLASSGGFDNSNDSMNNMLPTNQNGGSGAMNKSTNENSPLFIDISEESNNGGGNRGNEPVPTQMMPASINANSGAVAAAELNSAPPASSSSSVANWGRPNNPAVSNNFQTIYQQQQLQFQQQQLQQQQLQQKQQQQQQLLQQQQCQQQLQQAAGPPPPAYRYPRAPNQQSNMQCTIQNCYHCLRQDRIRLMQVLQKLSDQNKTITAESNFRADSLIQKELEVGLLQDANSRMKTDHDHQMQRAELLNKQLFWETQELKNRLQNAQAGNAEDKFRQINDALRGTLFRVQELYLLAGGGSDIGQLPVLVSQNLPAQTGSNTLAKNNTELLFESSKEAISKMQVLLDTMKVVPAGMQQIPSYQMQSGGGNGIGIPSQGMIGGGGTGMEVANRTTNATSEANSSTGGGWNFSQGIEQPMNQNPLVINIKQDVSQFIPENSQEDNMEPSPPPNYAPCRYSQVGPSSSASTTSSSTTAQSFMGNGSDQASTNMNPPTTPMMDRFATPATPQPQQSFGQPTIPSGGTGGGYQEADYGLPATPRPSFPHQERNLTGTRNGKICHICKGKERFYNAQALTRHMREVHKIHLNDPEKMCTKCGKSFKSAKYAKQHEKKSCCKKSKPESSAEAK